MPLGVPVIIGRTRDIKLREDIKHGFLDAESFVGGSSGLDEEVG